MPRLQIDEQVAPDGQLVGLYLVDTGTHFELLRGEQLVGVLSAKVIIEVLKRYGRPLQHDPEGVSAPFVLQANASLCSWRYRAPVDLEAKLYLLLYRGDDEPIAVLSRQVASALCFVCGAPG